MNINECKHEKPVLRKSEQASGGGTGVATMLLHHCKECNSTRTRRIFTLSLRGLTVCSEDTGPWVAEVPASEVI